jgi:FAD/FMN-containing dehydrogenase
MGGQIATEGGLHIDMRRFDRIVALDVGEKTITVQAGTRWRQIQERIDPDNLSVKIMQTYADFTVGGSLSVNAHGRYVGFGPLIQSVKSITVVLADGTLVTATPTRNSDVFYGVIGGYGGLGVITEATLELVDNERLRRVHRTMPVEAYANYFMREVLQPGGVVLHNGDLYPNDYDTVDAVSYVETSDPVTVPDRLVAEGHSYRLNRLLFWVVSEWPGGKGIRRYLVDPIELRGEPVSWRNHEASYTTAELEPASRERSTYVLQEYFVPVKHFDEFVPRLRAVLRQHAVNVINVSIRFANADPGSILAWARTDVFAFVLYYKQGTDPASVREAGVWTRELVDAALNVGGSYYLPYQLHATVAQFRQAYPRSAEFFALKKRLDPTNKFRNELWDKYHPDPSLMPVASAHPTRSSALEP